MMYCSIEPVNAIIISFFRSETFGNCLYSSASLVMVGDSSLVISSRILTSVELLKQQKAEVAYSNAVLERVFGVIKYLAKCSNSFQGHCKLLGSV